jgi:hypothetical protein
MAKTGIGEREWAIQKPGGYEPLPVFHQGQEKYPCPFMGKFEER